MKIYEYSKHKSFEVDPADINLSKTKNEGFGFTDSDIYEDFGGGKKWHGHEVFVKRNTKYDWPNAMEGVFYVNEKTWKKITTQSRNRW